MKAERFDEPTAFKLYAWRHPRAKGAEGRCIGRTDLPVDPRRAKRLAHRIRALARRQQLPRIVITSPLQRSRAVGRWLARWGWQHRVDAALAEMDFGAWDGRPWSEISKEAFDAWCDDFLEHAPGAGESVSQLLHRVLWFEPGAARVVVTHGGWLSATQWWSRHGHGTPTPAGWPKPVSHGVQVDLLWPPPGPQPVGSAVNGSNCAGAVGAPAQARR
jgi:alpha-ribazole phosphatase